MQEPKQTLPYGGDRLQTKIRKVRGNNEKSRNHVQQGPGQTLPYRGDLFQTNTRKVKGNIEQLRHHVQQEPEQTLPYHIHRTASQQLPVYHDSKRGGNLLQTKIRNISGNIEPLRHAVQRALGLGDEQIVINRLTGHIIIKVFQGGKQKQDPEANWRPCTRDT